MKILDLKECGMGGEQIILMNSIGIIKVKIHQRKLWSEKGEKPEKNRHSLYPPPSIVKLRKIHFLELKKEREASQ
ncbi:hypothetical protein [Pseudobacillus badius]|uniref:hypothetical protein n=1 Tax=Bacillus badius TaxID=1455 RepID=UPI00255429E2|nr:hypothetical protein [Bacillus badius]UAT32411.1 hypothetical protein K7T73_09460 [Bacillus badius]